MTGLERTLAFIKGQPADRPPFHPIIMRWAAKYAGVAYRDFCTIPEVKCSAMIKCARDFGIDWVTVMSDPWAEASAFGIVVDYPENDLPVDTGGHLPDAASVSLLEPFDPLSSMRCANRLEEIRYFRKNAGSDLFIAGWVEGPVAEYVDLRRASEAAMDLFIDPVNVGTAMDIIVESAKRFIALQIEAGAHCIGIGDAFCSQIGPELYLKFAFERQKQMVSYIHDRGAVAKLHICGNTSSILRYMIETGADIIDIDHLVPSMRDHVPLLGAGQFFSGKSDPVTVIQDGTAESIAASVQSDFMQAEGRCIVSAGCEVTPGTTAGNMHAFRQAAESLQRIM